MGNPIAILLRPTRAVFLCVAMLVGYGAALLGTFDVEESPLTDASDITRVELLR